MSTDLQSYSRFVIRTALFCNRCIIFLKGLNTLLESLSFALYVKRQMPRQRKILRYQAIKSKWTCCFKTEIQNHSFNARKKIWNENVQRKFCQECSNLPFAVPGNVKLNLPIQSLSIGAFQWPLTPSITYTAKNAEPVAQQGLNNVLLPTLFIAVNDIEQCCWDWIGCNNIVQYCWQLWTMWAAKHYSILFSSILHQPERFYACT
jgi:hypothetical protein